MKFETVTYFPEGGHPWYYSNVLKTFHEKKVNLPESVKKHFIIVPTYGNENYIMINLENKGTVDYLDTLFAEMISNNKCSRRYSIEIDEKEIPNYTHFRIDPIYLEYARYVFADVKRPDCGGIVGSRDEGCHVGAKLLSPVKVKKKKTSKIDIAVLNYPWEKDIVLLFSARMKQVFEAEGITGLVYEQVAFLDSAKRIDYYSENGINHIKYQEINEDNSPDIPEPYLTRIPKKIFQKASEISISELICLKHHICSFNRVVNAHISRKNLCPEDIFQINGIRVGGQVYHYRKNSFCISRKMLELLLKHKANGLCKIGFHLKSRFAPLVG